MRNAFALAAVGLLTLTACDDVFDYNKSHGVSVEGDDFCAVQEIFEASCNSCHSPGGGPLGGLDLESDPYNAIVGVSSAAFGTVLVEAGNKESSLLWKKSGGTQGDSEGGSMPLGATVSEDNLAVIGAWIDAGAEDCDSGSGTDDSGTDDSGTDDSGTDDSGTDDSGTESADWCAVQAMITSNRCLDCHNAAGAGYSGGLDLETDPYAALVGVESQGYTGEWRVRAGDSAHSVLYRKLQEDGGDFGGRMPQGGDPIPQDALEDVASWIDGNNAANADCN